MNAKHWMLWLVTLSSALTLSQTLADIPLETAKTPPATPRPAVKADADQPADAGQVKHVLGQPGTGLIKANDVLVRGQASLKSEVITRLNKGDRVTVLEEISFKKPPAGEPDKWLKITLPKDAPVWVNSQFIDAATKTVKATRLNLRSGPGENYSVLGRLDKGAAIQEVETKGEWIKLQAPADTYAFVAAHLVHLDGATTPPAVAAIPPPVNPPPATPPTAEVIPATPSNQVAVVTTPTEVAPPPTETVPAPAATTPGATAPQPPVAVTEPAPGAEAVPPPAEEPPKRTVTREGVVKRSVSIQAPTEFMLESVDNRRTINYLYSPSSNIFLLDFKGHRVRVSGEEGLDDRWPKTPVLTVETLKSVP